MIDRSTRGGGRASVESALTLDLKAHLPWTWVDQPNFRHTLSTAIKLIAFECLNHGKHAHVTQYCCTTRVGKVMDAG